MPGRNLCRSVSSHVHPCLVAERGAGVQIALGPQRGVVSRGLRPLGKICVHFGGSSLPKISVLTLHVKVYGPCL